MSKSQKGSFGTIEQVVDPPTTDDQVTMDDPTSPPEAQPVPGSSAPIMDDSDGAITHLPRETRGRTMSPSDLLGLVHPATNKADRADKGGKGKTLPDDAMSGTPGHGERWVRDDALQVRQLAPTGFTTTQIATPVSGIAVALVPERLERMTCIVQNSDTTNAVYLVTGSSGTAASGFVLGPGAAISIDATCSIFACSVVGVSVVVSSLDQYRTDVDAD